MYRKITLTNSIGQTWALTDESFIWYLTEHWPQADGTFKVFLNDPQGFGVTDNLTVTTFGNIQRVDDEQFNFPQVSGEILFYDDTNSERYFKYHYFCRFITHTPLTLTYELPIDLNKTPFPLANYSFTLPCYVTSLGKTETKRDGILTCPVTFQGLDFWKGEEETFTASGGNPIKAVTNNGDYEVGFEITINGTNMVNPYFTVEADGEVYGEARFITDTGVSSVYVNSNDTEQNVILMNGNVVLANPLSYQDLSITNGTIYVTFVKLKWASNSTITVGMDSGTLSDFTIKMTPRYRSV